MTFTKEQLQHIIETDHVQCGEASALARIALASLEAEPVAYIDPFSLQNFATYRAGETDNKRMGREWMWADSDAGLAPVYAAQPAPVMPDDIDARMKNAGMLSAAEIIAGQPIDAFMKHAGVVDLESLLKWSEMRRAEFLRMQAKYELGDNQKDDMYEWVISHVAAFSELHVNIRAAMLQGAEPSKTGLTLREGLAAIRNSGIAIDAEKIQAERYALNSPAIPDGYALVPVEPTLDMVKAGAAAASSGMLIPGMYRAMLAAAPQQEA
ncbi:hypothetical protein [Escherichia coli]|uniref:hypothetical protein n=1 Tax=Escherichia coli TaxID=562 RepID=UPI003F5780F0